MPKLLKTQDWPKFVEKKVRAYHRDIIKELLAGADEEFRLVLRFFLGSGCREAEVSHACWTDLDFRTGEFTVQAHPEFGFRPKDCEERSVPLPSDLLADLRVRRDANPGARLIFPNRLGKPEGHFLRQLKELALDCGLNCGACINKAGKSCPEYAVCSRFELHQLRRTFASLHHRNGISARTIQKWLGHSDLETTLRYLAADDNQDAQIRGIVDSTFAGLTPPLRPELVA